MVKVICQHSAIEFEADSKRTKQHPKIAALKAESNKRGNYREVNAALDAVRKAGGYSTIAEYMALVEQHLKGKIAERDAQAAKWREQAQREEEAREIARQQREQQNAVLKANGYRWEKHAIGTEGGFSYGAGIGEFSHYEWVLWSPDNRVVSVADALYEIERGIEVVAAERAAKAAAERAQREAAEREAAEREAAYKAIEDEAKSLQEVERITADEMQEAEEIIRYRAGQWGELRVITRCKVRDVACYIVSRYGDMDYSWYYCADPAQAGLTRKSAEISITLASDMLWLAVDNKEDYNVEETEAVFINQFIAALEAEGITADVDFDSVASMRIYGEADENLIRNILNELDVQYIQNQ